MKKIKNASKLKSVGDFAQTSNLWTLPQEKIATLHPPEIFLQAPLLNTSAITRKEGCVGITYKNAL